MKSITIFLLVFFYWILLPLIWMITGTLADTLGLSILLFLSSPAITGLAYLQGTWDGEKRKQND